MEEEGDIEALVRRELTQAGMPHDSEFASMVLSGKLVRKAEVMDAVRWDSRYVQAILRDNDNKFNPEGREKRLPAGKRVALYNEAADIIKADAKSLARYLPQETAGYNLFDITKRLSAGQSVSFEEADFAAGIFSRYNTLYLDMFRINMERVPF